MEGSHSPFGVVWQIATATGWSVRYILWKVNYQTLLMMAADQPRYITAEEQKLHKRRHAGKKRGKGVSKALSFFQTRLKSKR